MEETQTQPPDRGLVKQSASTPPSAPGPTTTCPLQSAAGLIPVKTPTSPLPSAPCPVSVDPTASPPPRAPAPSLVKPPATPPQRSPVRREASASPAPSKGWVLLDRCIHCSRRRRGVFGADDPTTSVMAQDCVGRPIRASLRIADPPVLSRLYLHWTIKPQIEDVMDPLVVAAHRHSILFKVHAPFEDPDWWHNSCSFPVDYFVYSASSDSNLPPSLTRLPPCFDDDRPRVVKPYRRQQQRFMMDQDVGLLCHGEACDEFTVAHLRYHFQDHVELCILHHPPRSSGSTPTQWRIKKLPTALDMKINPSEWTTDTIFPIDGCLCWVDYYQGLLLVDVLLANGDRESSPDQQLLRCIPLPKLALKSSRRYKDAFSPDPFRHVCVTDAGIVKLVVIFTEYSQSTFTIITWSLNIHKGIWTKELSTIIGDSEFFGLFDAAQSNLPRVTPSFPVVSLADPDIICFLLKELDDDQNTYWVIEVNMREKVLLSTAMYIREEEEEGYSPEKLRWNFYGQYFVPSRFPSYLGQDDFKSRELSLLMEEKAKQRRSMQKGAQLENLLTQKKERQCQAKGKEAQLKNLKKKKAKQHQAKGRRRH